jgi:hypothetical protein
MHITTIVCQEWIFYQVIHLKPFRDALLRNEYELIEIKAPENLPPIVTNWKEEQLKNLDVKAYHSKMLASAFLKVEEEAKKEKSLPIRKIYIHMIEGEPFIAWSAPYDRELDSKRAQIVLFKHLSPLGYKVYGLFSISSDKQDRNCSCYFFGFDKTN